VPANIAPQPEGFLTFQAAEMTYGDASPLMALLKKPLMTALGAERENGNERGRFLLAHGSECPGRANLGKPECTCIPGQALREGVRVAVLKGTAAAGVAAALKVVADAATGEETA
jgi:hypothetical protein